ncbi:MAG: phosphoribosyltransferase family protein [Leptospirillia bacterium]
MQSRNGVSAPSAATPLAGRLHGALGGFLERLFPADCRGCERPLAGAPNAWFCAVCWGDLEVIDDSLCDHCGLALARGAVDAGDLPARRCGNCIKTPPAFDRLRTLGLYQGVLARAVQLLKYRERTGLARALVERADLGVLPPEFHEADRVVPVPLYPARLRTRGFNQSTRIARALGGRLEVPVQETALARVRSTRTQVGLSRKERVSNVAHAFQVVSATPLRGRSVILVDDVVTTGATVSACVRALKRAGVKQVTVWALARQHIR